MAAPRPKPAATRAQRDAASSGLLARHPHAVYLGVLALLLVVFFREALFEDKVFFVPDNMSSIVYEDAYIGKAKADGVNAFWNPYIFAGMPTWGSSSPGHGLYLHTFLDPFKPMLVLQVYGWVQAAIGVLRVPSIFWDIANFFLLGLFTYFFGLRRRFDPFAAFLAAVSVVFTLYSLNWIMAGHNTKITVFAWIPAMLLLVDLLFEKRTILRALLLAGAMHLAFNSGHVQMVYYAAMALGLYILFKWYEGAQPLTVLTVGLITFGAAVFAFLMLSGPYFATWEYKDFSIRGAGSGGSGHGTAATGLDYEYATNWSFSPIEIITFFIPSFVGFGTPTYWGSMMFTESPIYLGIVGCTIALAALILKPRDRFVHYLAVLGLFALLVSLGRNFGLVYDLLFKHLPFFNNFRIPSMILCLEGLVIALLLGTGLTEILRRLRERRKGAGDAQLTRALWIPAGIGVLFVLILLASAGTLKERIAEDMQKHHPNVYQGMEQVERAVASGQSVPPDYAKLTRDAIYDMAKDDAILALVLMLAATGVLWALGTGRMPVLAAQLALFALLVIDLWIVDVKPMRMSPSVEVENQLARTDVVDFLQQQRGRFRILPVAHADDNYYVSFGIESAAGYHPAKLKLYDDIRNQLFGQFVFQNPQQMDGANWALLSMLNVRYAVVPNKWQLQAPWLKRVFDGAQEAVYENQYVLPRAFFAARDTVITDDAAMFRTIGTLPGYRPDKLAYLSAPPPRAVAPLSDADQARTKAEFTHHGINSMRLSVHTPAEAVLKIGDSWYPSGWTATIDGKPAEILRSDYAFRALVVPAGTHAVELRFEPRSYRTGLLITSLTNYLFMLILLVYGVMWARRRFGAPRPAAGSDNG